MDLNPTVLNRQWLITIDTPVGGVDQVVKELGKRIPLVLGSL